MAAETFTCYLLGNTDVLNTNEGTVKLCAHAVPGAQRVTITVEVTDEEPLAPGDILVADADASELAVIAVEDGTAVVRTAAGFELRPVADLKSVTKSRREIERQKAQERDAQQEPDVRAEAPASPAKGRK